MDTNKNAKPETLNITGNWNEQSKKLKTKYTELTDSDLKFEKGKENELLGRLESRLKKNRQEVIGIVNKTQKA